MNIESFVSNEQYAKNLAKLSKKTQKLCVDQAFFG